jgi:Tol biopolymer transport system component
VRIRLLVLAFAVAALGGSAHAGIGIPIPPPPGDAEPTWSPDGSAIVFWSSRTPNTLRVVGPDGHGEHPIPVPGAIDYAFSPDWFWVAFPAGGSALVVMRPDGSQRHEIIPVSYGVAPSWSPDGRRLVFQAPTGIYIVNTDGSGLRKLADGGAYARWSPRGDRIAYIAGSYAAPLLRVAWADRTVDTPVLRPGSVRFGPVEWSPDGTRIGFLSPPAVDRAFELGIVDVDSGDTRRFPLTSLVSSLAWSPNRSVIALGGDRLQLVDLQTESIRTILPYGDFPQWSPDGDQLAFSAGGECRNRSGIYRLDVFGGPPGDRITNDCRIVGTSGPDVLFGTPLADVIIGLAGDDRLQAVSTDGTGDTLEGDEGNDVLVGSDRADTLHGGPGADRLNGGASGDELWGGPGRDVLNGGGGSDLIDARDAARDVVSCGTNAVKSTAPTETDMAYVDKIDVVSKDCEFVWYLGTVPPPKGKISLTIALSPNSAKPRVGRRTYTLRCRPAAGTLPRRASACAQLLRVQNPFAPVPRDQACTQIYGGPQQATVIGVYGGKPVRTTFTRTDGCQIARWNRVRFLFPIATGVR